MGSTLAGFSASVLPVTPTPPRTLDEVRAVADPVQRVKAAQAYLARLESFRGHALRIRDDAVRSLDDGPTKIADQTGLTIHLVKWIRRAR